MFDGFQRVVTEIDGVPIHAVHGGSGPPVLLLHGFPQTHAMWHVIGPELARDHTVVAPDLRGYGDSGRPASGEDHAGYSFRAMAADQVGLMRALGHEEFAVVAHDRGARVAHRTALDHPAAVTRAALLDILPTTHVYDHVTQAVATAYYHWFFFIQPADLPERLIAADPVGYLHSLLGGWGSGLDAFAPEALAEYERCFADPDARHAMLEDYRAGASIDLEHDRADAGRRVTAPLLALWGSRSVVGASPIDPLEVWRGYGEDVRGATVDAGHFLVEEQPGATLAALRTFLRP
ncbi:alpha/beta hydrolase [Pseudonocardia petroleophila]|uniref:Alpha/beta fold hydrolase n=1 Tax=Pseudonocardia petroleophila TaxID=37331 RepID=A0A7G7MPR2_9PSEU|nr:alpha/beta fold hydrolase [Pseudonocardia petroleophila]QNG54773.1 alpha/beta fold hydrolase [Pseudonocardia petroleophila]